MMRLHLLAVYWLTFLGSTLTSQIPEEISSTNADFKSRVKRGGWPGIFGRRNTHRRQSFVRADKPGQISFSIPLLSELGLPQPVAQYYNTYYPAAPVPFSTFFYRRMDSARQNFLPNLMASFQTMKQKAGPIVRDTASAWRQTVDDHIAPTFQAGLEYVGQKTADGVDELAGAVLGEEGKKKTMETVGALGTLAKAMISTDEQVEEVPVMTAADYQNFHYQAFPTPGQTFEAADFNPRHDFKDGKTYFNSKIPGQTVGEAFYVLGKNILGQNVTDRLLPVAKNLAEGFGQVGEGLTTLTKAIPISNIIPTVEFDAEGVRLKTQPDPQQEVQNPEDFRGERNAEPASASAGHLDQRISSNAPKCTTPQRGEGRCMDIQNCPLLLADLDLLRKSICFKSLFVPGVCCPDTGVQVEVVDENLNVVNEVQEIQPQGTTTAGPFSVEQPPDLSDIFASQKPKPGSTKGNTVPGTSIECGSAKIPQARIVGGNTTFEGEYPWMVAIYLHGKGRREFWCGGALITRQHVITAAHCTRDAKKRPFRPSQFTVRVGEWDLSDQDNYSEEFRVIDFTAHPKFRPNGFYNDVAVFTLDQPVDFTPHIQPICLPHGRHLKRAFVTSLPVALGWGTTHYGGQEVSKLRGVPLPVWKNKDCDAAYFQPITEVFLCAGYADGGRDACQGDSGGPLMLYDEDTQSWMLIGIVSFGNRCAEPGYPGVYTRITHFMDFIENLIL